MYIARYNGAHKQRIFTSSDTNINWLSGFWSGNTGLAFHNSNAQMGTTGDPFGSNFFLSTDQNALYRAGGAPGCLYSGGTSNAPLGINNSGEPSDWAVAVVLVYSRTLSSSEITDMESWLNYWYNL
jgi:hypothetical protein